MITVLDSSALIAFLRDEVGEESVALILGDPHRENYAHAINICEVHYHAIREYEEAYAEHAIQLLISLGLNIVEEMDTDLWRAVGRYKARLKRISLADCFCLALANKLGAELVTADHHEFDRVSAQGLANVRFIR